jgi:hypothetical protein
MIDPRSRQVRPGSDAATFLALLALVMIAIGLLLLVAVVLPFVPGLILCLGGFVLISIFHYLVWGWLMPAAQSSDDTSVSRDAESSERSASP